MQQKIFFSVMCVAVLRVGAACYATQRPLQAGNTTHKRVEVDGRPAMSSVNNGRFLYFAFGSNLLKERLQLANPSAVFHAIGRLKDHELNFGVWGENVVSRVWHGGVATIQCCPGGEVWGVIWSLSNEHMASLDRQEEVGSGMYSPLDVPVETDKGTMRCRTYQMNNFHPCPPSPQYKLVVCKGAEQNGLPPDYIKRLEAIQTNDYSGPSLMDKIRVDSP